MAYVTDNKKVKEIIEDLRHRRITEAVARSRIRALPFENGRPKGWLGDGPFADWEIDEAIKAASL